MGTFKDSAGTEWRVALDPSKVTEIREHHKVDLVGLEHDPLGPLRNDPMLLVTVVSVLCREQMQAANLKPAEFGKLLPFPPDPMLEAVQEAIISFFPAGRASHVREVLRKFGQMAATTDSLALAKMQQVMDDPRVTTTLNQRADRVIEAAMNELIGAGPGM